MKGHSFTTYCQADNTDPIYQVDPGIKDTSDTTRSTSYFDLDLEIDSQGRFRTSLSDKRHDFIILIVNIFHLDVASYHKQYIQSISLSVDTVFRAGGSF